MKKIFGSIPISIVITVLLLLGTVGAISAKYISTLQEQNKTFTAPDFYFKSNVMTEESDPTPISVMGNEATVTITNGTGPSQYSNVDIPYTLRYYVEKDGEWVLVNTVEGQRLKKDTLSSASLTLTPIEYESQTYKTVKVEAESVSPFTKTLCACIEFQALPFTVSYTYDSFVITARLQTNVSFGNFDISYAESVSPDSADENGVLNTAPIGPASITASLESNHTYLLKFFVTDEAVHNAILAAADQNAYVAEELISISQG